MLDYQLRFSHALINSINSIVCFPCFCIEVVVVARWVSLNGPTYSPIFISVKNAPWRMDRASTHEIELTLSAHRSTLTSRSSLRPAIPSFHL